MIELHWQEWVPAGFGDPSGQIPITIATLPYNYTIVLKTQELGPTAPDPSMKKVLVFRNCQECLALLHKIKTYPDLEKLLTRVGTGVSLITATKNLPPRVEKKAAILCFIELKDAGAWIGQVFHNFLEHSFQETIIVGNSNKSPVSIRDFKLGFRVPIDASLYNLRLVAIPFKIQVDGKEHDYTAANLVEGRFNNSNNAITDLPWKQIPDLADEGKLRSEAWALTLQKVPPITLLVAKYNNQHIEHSVCEVETIAGKKVLRFGGTSLSLYSEPQESNVISPGECFQFGTTRYELLDGDWKAAYYAYRDFLVQQGHGFPPTYDPPVNWNELYDVGWYHSDAEALAEFYTRDALLEEARKAHEIGCQLLYLDPGWEINEGVTQWDEKRLGSLPAFIKELYDKFGLPLGFRTIGRTYRENYPKDWMVVHKDLDKITPLPAKPSFAARTFLEPCTGVQAWRELKRERILNIAGAGMRFIMFDEFDYRGPCFNASHGHNLPTTPLEHARVVFSHCRAVRSKYPDILIETHDPVWPWQNRYLPTYFQQGFEYGAFQENWGFEFMWSPLKQLQSGNAMALYYYALGCPIPLYLHIPMAPDNEHSIFFWFVASTVRHLGIGGKIGTDTITGGKPTPVNRWEQYKQNMQKYLELKPYFTRGTFYGISKECHLHVLPRQKGGVINLFNLSHLPEEKQFMLPRAALGLPADSKEKLSVHGADARWTKEGLQISAKLEAWDHRLVQIS